jgi:hypothetical protein
MEGNQMFIIFAPKRQKSVKQEGPKSDGNVKQGPPMPPGTGDTVQS